MEKGSDDDQKENDVDEKVNDDVEKGSDVDQKENDIDEKGNDDNEKGNDVDEKRNDANEAENDLDKKKNVVGEICLNKMKSDHTDETMKGLNEMQNAVCEKGHHLH